MKQCVKCNEVLEIDQFRERIYRGFKSFRIDCRKCESKARMKRPYSKLSDVQREKKLKGQREFCRLDRQKPENNAKYIVIDALKGDKKKGFENNLSESMVADLIKDGCYYCGDRTTRMTLDRIDNKIGHVYTNVHPACNRCNMIRGSMPFEAWECIIPAMKEAFERGLFGSWVGGRIGYKVVEGEGFEPSERLLDAH
jgi:hypothetical protein